MNKENLKHEKLVNNYFEQIKSLRSGVDRSVENLTDMWDDDGVFEFCGTPPLNAKYCGRTAIKTLYKNRLAANGMEVALDTKSAKTYQQKEVTVSDVDTKVKRLRTHDDKVVAGWSTKVGTKQGVGFNVSGSHTFAFKGDKISKLKVVISPKVDDAVNLKHDDLTINDIGRLALAAWPVV